MTAQTFTVWRKLDRRKVPEALFAVFAIPWGMAIWTLFLGEALGFDLPKGTNKWMFIPIAAVFLPMQWMVIRNLLDRRPLVVVDARGILSRFWSETVIPWAAIRRVRPVTIWGFRRFVSLDLHHPEDYPATTGLKWTAWANRKAGYGDVSIQLDGTDTDQAQLIRVIEQFRNAAASPGVTP
ncbi:MAG: STM3941 family protein [Phenylobacterium sp.]